MAEFFFNFGLFALKAVLLAAFAGGFLVLISGALFRSSSRTPERLEITRINERLEREQELIKNALMDDEALHFSIKQKHAEEKAERKARKKELKKAKKRGDTLSSAEESPLNDSADAEQAKESKRRVYVLDFDGDLQATAVTNLRRELTAVLSAAGPQDEIVLRLESGGGAVHSYGLASSQLKRVRSKKIKLTVCVDKVAASGGYMMACVADQILAAPFAIIGSIGVVAQLPNFNRLLKKHDVDFELLTAGKHKRTLTLFGENTESGRDKFREDLNDTHALFKEFVVAERPQLDIEKVATGDIWYGARALDEKLVDRVTTSDDYLSEICGEADVLEVSYVEKKSVQDKLMSSVEMMVERSVMRWWSRATLRDYL